MNVIVIVETFIAFVIAVTLHEAAHAAMATLLGDSTAVSRGRLTLAPRRQMAPIGTIVALVLSFRIPPASLGWGRPMEIDARRMRVGPNAGTILVALAGPLLNIILGAGIAAGLSFVPAYPALTHQLLSCGGTFGQGLQTCLAPAQPWYILRLEQFAFILAAANIVLALLNIIPLHPLDGYHVLFALLPSGPAISLRNFAPYMELLLLVIFFVIPLILEFAGIVGVSPAGWLMQGATAIAYHLSGSAYAFYLAL